MLTDDVVKSYILFLIIIDFIEVSSPLPPIAFNVDREYQIRHRHPLRDPELIKKKHPPSFWILFTHLSEVSKIKLFEVHCIFQVKKPLYLQ